MKPFLQNLLVRPACRGSLVFEESTATCKVCQVVYPVRAGIPALIPNDSPFRDLPDPATPPHSAGLLPPWARRLVRPYLEFNPPLTMWFDRSLFQCLNCCSADMRILNIGSGVGRFDSELSPHLNFVNLDISLQGQVDVVADAHWLPFPNESFHAVYSNAVLEHVQRPWRVAEEIYRVLRPEGRIFINVPFLNIIHDTHDYFRFTDKDLDILFARFRKMAGGVSAGPSSFLGPFPVEYIPCGILGPYLKALVRPLLNLLAWPVKYFDLPIRRSPTLRLTADAFYFAGIKQG